MAKREHSTSLEANGEHTPTEESRKRQRTDSPPTTKKNDTPQRAAAPTLTPEEKQKLRVWLDKKAATDEIPFPITYPKLDALKGGKKGRARKSMDSTSSDPKSKESLTLDNHKYGEVTYSVGNKQKWEQLSRYRRCTVSEQTFVVGGCVFVRSDETDEEGNTNSLTQWKAQIHEVRALDANHVYLRVSWLLRPQHDLPNGAKSYHAVHELIPSTNIDIIDAKTINASLSIKYWDEFEDAEGQLTTEFFWRQSYDHINDKMTDLRSMCSCAQPQNPDQPIIQCSQPKCGEWLHAKCVEQSVLDKHLANRRANGATNGTPGKKGATDAAKKARTSKVPDLRSDTEGEGMKAKLHEEDGKITVTLEDSKDGSITEETSIDCPVCGAPIEG